MFFKPLLIQFSNKIAAFFVLFIKYFLTNLGNLSTASENEQNKTIIE